MPQMAPINWLTLFFMFSFIFVLFCVVNYFNYYITYPLNNNNLMINKNNFFLNWKW